MDKYIFLGCQKQNKGIMGKDYLIPVVFFLLITFSYGLFFSQTYVALLVGVYDNNPNLYLEFPDLGKAFWDYMSGGRITSLIIIVFNWAYAKIGIDAFNNVWVLRLNTFFLSSIAASILYFLFKPLVDDSFKYILAGCIMIGFINPAYVEAYIYPGSSHALAILLGVIGVVFFTRKRYFISSIIVFLSIGIYQSYYSLFVTYTFLYIFLFNKGAVSKNCFKQVINAVAVVFFPLMITYILPAIARLNGHIPEKPFFLFGGDKYDLHHHIDMISTAYWATLKDAYGFVPSFFIFITLSVAAMTTMSLLLIRKDWISIGVFLIVFFALQISPFAYGLGSETPQFWTRTMVTFYMSLGAIFIVCFCYILGFDGRECLFRYIALQFIRILLVVFLVVMMYGVQIGISDILVSNRVEIQMCNETEEKIRRYEMESGNAIKEIRVAHYTEGRSSFDRAYCKVKYNTYYSEHSVLYKTEGVSLINIITGENYVIKEATELEKKEKFGKIINKAESLKRYRPDEQLVFDGDVLFWMLY